VEQFDWVQSAYTKNMLLWKTGTYFGTIFMTNLIPSHRHKWWLLDDF